MVIRPVAEVVADFPDDQVEAGCDIVQFGGRGVAAAIGEMMRALGYEVSDPRDEAEHGWTLEAVRDGFRCWLQVTDMGGGNHILTTDVLRPKVSWRFWSTPPYRYPEFLTDMDAALRRDGRFREIKWFADYSSPTEIPSDRPVGD